MDKKKIVIISVVALLLLGGIGFALFSGEESQPTDDNASQIADTNQSDADASPFRAVDGNYTMNLTITESDGTQTIAAIQVEDSDTYRVVIEGQDGGEFIYDGQTFYTKTGTDGRYTAFDLSQTGSDFGAGFADAFVQDASLVGLYDSAERVGTDSCAVGTCDVYEYTDPETGETATVKVSDDRIIEISSENTDAGERVTVVYDYDSEVDIEIPTDAERIEFPNSSGTGSN